MVQITLSSSLKYKEIIRETIIRLEKVGINGIFPNLDSGVAKEDVNLDFMRKLESEHFEAIDSSKALYIICPGGYVGTLVSVEVGYARAKGKTIIFSEQPEDLGLQALATKVISLDDLALFPYKIMHFSGKTFIIAYG
jgi:hypothetical protein